MFTIFKTRKMLKAQIDRLHKDIDLLELELDRQQEANSNLGKDYRAVLLDRDKYCEGMHTLQVQLDELRVKYKELQEEQSAAEDVNHGLASSVSDLKKRLAGAKSRITYLTRQMDKMKAEK